MSQITKAGTGYGATLIISSTAASLASPAPAPDSSPTSWLLTSPPSGIPVLQLKTFTMPNQKWSFDDITNTSSPTVGAGTVKENLLTVLDVGEFTAEGVYLPSDSGLEAITTAFATGVPNQFQIVLGLLPGQSSTGNVYEFNAYVQTNPLPQTVSVEKAITWKVDLKLTTFVTVTIGS